MAFCVSKRTLRFCRLCGMLAGGDYRRRLMRMSGEAVQVAASSFGDRLSPTLLHVLAICSHVRSGRDARQNPGRPNDLLRKPEFFGKRPKIRDLMNGQTRSQCALHTNGASEESHAYSLW